MLSGIIGKIFGALFSSIIAKLDEWFTEQQLAEAQSKAEALKAYAESKDESEKVEEEMTKVNKEVDDLYKEGNTYKEKLAALRKANEARRLKKVKEKLQ